MAHSVKHVSGVLDPNRLTRIQVSMFNRHCTGTYLTAMVNWLQCTQVAEVEFQVSDTLQRHNFRWKRQKDEVRCQRMASEAGDQWLHENGQTISLSTRIFDKVCITRWEYWLAHPEHRQVEHELRRLMKTDDEFSDAIEREIDQYFLTLKRRCTPERRRAAVDFLLEEIAVSEVSARDGLSNEIYPGPRFIPEVHMQKKYPDRFAVSRANFIHVEFESMAIADTNNAVAIGA